MAETVLRTFMKAYYPRDLQHQEDGVIFDNDTGTTV